MRGGGPLDFRDFLQGDGVGNPPIWSGDLGHVPQDWEDSWRVPPQGGPPVGGNAANLGHDRQVGLTTDGRVNGGSGSGVGGDVRPPPPEYRSTVYRNSYNTGAMSGGGAAYGRRVTWR